MYQELIMQLKSNFNSNPKTNDELNHMLQRLFNNTNSNYAKLKKIYNPNKYSLFDRMQYEHYQVEKLKKEIYGDDYEIEILSYDKTKGKRQDEFLSL